MSKVTEIAEMVIEEGRKRHDQGEGQDLVSAIHSVWVEAALEVMTHMKNIRATVREGRKNK